MNKNWLFGTTALALAASFGAIAPANAQAFKTTNTEVTIGGYTRGFIGTSSMDRTSNQSLSSDVQMDARLDLTARFATANGMQAFGVIQIQDQGQGAFNSVQNRLIIDSVMRRAYAGIGGAFGAIRVGRDDNASQQGFVGSFDAFTAGGARLGKIYDFVAGGNPLTMSADDSGVGSTSIRLFDRQSEKLVYISPRIEGFQLLASWTPEVAAGRNGNTPAFSGPTYNNGLSAALNFTRPIGSVAVSAYGTYYQWTSANAVGTGTGANSFKLPDPSAYGFGLNAVWQGIQVGGSYTKYSDVANISRGSYTATDALPGSGGVLGNAGATAVILGDSVGYEGGIGYIFGPASVSLNYFNGEADVDAASRSNGAKTAAPLGKDERSAVSLSGAYTLAPGVSVQLSLFHLKQKGGYYNGVTSLANGIKTEQKATGAVSALILAF
jgi:hypothetical protein